jgi:hypothetical protein
MAAVIRKQARRQSGPCWPAEWQRERERTRLRQRVEARRQRRERWQHVARRLAGRA